MSEEEKEYRGFDLISESYYIKDDKWKVNDKCRVSPLFDEIEILYDTLENTTIQLKTKKIERKDGLTKIREATKSILEKTLIGFNYESALSNHGYLALDSIAMDLIHLFLRAGGMAEMKLATKRVKDMKDGLNGSKN